jgi:hypothetical protein
MIVAAIGKDGLFRKLERSIKLFMLDEEEPVQNILGENLSLHRLKRRKRYLIWYLLLEELRNRLSSTLARKENVRLVNLNITRHRFESLAREQGMDMALRHG